MRILWVALLVVAGVCCYVSYGFSGNAWYLAGGIAVNLIQASSVYWAWRGATRRHDDAG